MNKIEITFPVNIELTDDDYHNLNECVRIICKRYEKANPGRVMWAFGQGAKLTYMPMTRAEEEAGKHMEFDENVYVIDCSEREDYAWPCEKCKKPQGDHKGLILHPDAGDCDFVAAKKTGARR